jgi:hypothetical protein
LATATSGASIYYTTDGSSPTQSSKLYTGAMTLTASASVKAKAFKSGYNPSAEASASFASNLVAYWKFDEGTGTTTADSSGNGNTGILTNGPMWSAGRIGNALYFDGTDDIVTVADSNSLHLSNAFTLSAWVNPAATSMDWNAILVKNSKYYLYASTTGGCGNGSPMGGFSTQIINAVCQPSPLPANSWTHLTVTYDGSALTLYRDGVPVGVSPISGAFSFTTETLQIGGSKFGEYFKGLIDEVRIYKTALSDTEIQTIYQQESIGISPIVAAPLISPDGGSYASSISVAMQTATSGASIYYTTDGSTPTQSSTLYSGSMTLTSSKIVKARAFKSGYNGSTETDASFIVTQPFSFSLTASGNKSVLAGAAVSNTISATLDSGSSQAVSFSVSGLPTGATASFSTASCSPACSTVLNISTTTSTPAGSFPITVTSTGGGVTKTTVFTLSVTLALTVATPTITPNGGNFSGTVSVAMQTATSGASIYYTLDGSTPTQSSTLYTGAMALTSSAAVNAKAYKSGSNPSPVAGASFTVTNAGTGKSYYVAKTGSDSNTCAQAQNQSNPKLTIAAAFGCLQSGDTLNVSGGTYNESIGADQIRGRSGTSWSNPTTIQSYNNEKVIISGLTTCGVPLGEPIRYFVFRGLSMTAQVSLARCDSSQSMPDHIMFDQMDIHGIANAYVLGFGANDSIIRNSKIHDNTAGTDPTSNQYHCIYVVGSRNVIENTEIYNCANYGIHQYSTSVTMNDNVYRYNWIHDSGMDRQNVTTRAILICCSGSNNAAYGNLLTHVAEGIECKTDGCLIYNNTIYDAYRQNAYPVIILSGSATGARITNNILYNNAVNSIADLNNTASNVIRNNLLTDPKFVNPSGGNFRLQSTSPAINTGVTLTEVTTDIDSTLRPQGGAYDIGAFEYH